MGRTHRRRRSCKRHFPTRVWSKRLNQIAAPDMLAPDTSKGPRHMRICGNDQAAKAAVAELLAPFGWEVTDLGSVERARDLEATTLRWIRSRRS